MRKGLSFNFRKAREQAINLVTSTKQRRLVLEHLLVTGRSHKYPLKIKTKTKTGWRMTSDLPGFLNGAVRHFKDRLKECDGWVMQSGVCD